MGLGDLHKLALRLAALESGYSDSDIRRALATYRDEGKLPTHPQLRDIVQRLGNDLRAAWRTMPSNPTKWTSDSPE